jgi:hypothetical protein
MSDNLTTIIITVITLLFSGGAWKFYEMIVKNKREKNKEERSEQTIYRNDLRLRVDKLEKDKDECSQRLMELTEKVAALTVELSFIKKENERLKYR